jgi:hypothetical protein
MRWAWQSHQELVFTGHISLPAYGSHLRDKYTIRRFEVSSIHQPHAIPLSNHPFQVERIAGWHSLIGKQEDIRHLCPGRFAFKRPSEMRRMRLLHHNRQPPSTYRDARQRPCTDHRIGLVPKRFRQLLHCEKWTQFRESHVSRVSFHCEGWPNHSSPRPESMTRGPQHTTIVDPAQRVLPLSLPTTPPLSHLLNRGTDILVCVEQLRLGRR